MDIQVTGWWLFRLEGKEVTENGAHHPLRDVQMVPEEVEPVTVPSPLFGVWAQTRGGEWFSFTRNSHFKAGTVKCAFEELRKDILVPYGPFLGFCFHSYWQLG